MTVLGRRQDRSGAPWVSVRLAVLPNGTTGWVPRRALGGYGTVTPGSTWICAASAPRSTRRAAGAPRAGGSRRRGLADPTGVIRPQPADPLPQPRLRAGRLRNERPLDRATDWPAGGFVGIHGTDHPELLPGRVSHGCVRMRNADILELARRMPVGTPVTIH